VWGYPAEARVFSPQLKKLDPKTLSCFFIGYRHRGRYIASIVRVTPSSLWRFDTWYFLRIMKPMKEGRSILTRGVCSILECPRYRVEFRSSGDPEANDNEDPQSDNGDDPQKNDVSPPPPPMRKKNNEKEVRPSEMIISLTE
jgi:hypothetical protein